MGKLDGKVALVTGSGRNIGRATVLKLAEEGAHVVVNARSNHAEADAVVREARELGVKALAVVADVASKDQVEAMAARALSEFGRVDILINNAAIRPHKPFTELTQQDWEAVRGVVLDGALYLTRALIEPMVSNNYGRILFFTGEGAFVGGSGRAHVSAAKMGLVGFARGLASEFAAHNIRVNVVSPGSIDTMRANPEWYQGRTPNAAGIPLGRQGKVDEIAATCLFLVTDDGGFITGQTIHVNGPVTIRDSSDARNTAMLAMSSGSISPTRCAAASFVTRGLRASSRPRTRSVIVADGAIALTRTFCGANSTAIDRVIAAMPPFAAV